MIGVFDSGVGGLTVLKAMRASFPSIDVVYFGDTKNSPYGSRGRDELSRLAVEGVEFLVGKGATSIVCACNSVSVSLALSLYDLLSIPEMRVIEMIGPCVASFRGSGARITLVATQATVESGMYQNAFRMIGKDIRAVAIPGLAQSIEEGEGETAYEAHIRAALAAIPEDLYDTLVLGCTHYPIAMASFRVAAPGKTIVDPADSVASRVERDLWPREMGYGRTDFYISKDSARFRALVDELFPDKNHTVHVVD